ncbi:MAG: CHAT domain-containing protein [Nocardioides sp.]
MNALNLYVRVQADGTVALRDLHPEGGGKRNPTTKVDLEGLDGRVLRLFEKWLTVPNRSWTEEEIRVLGQLLHRRLFVDDSWRWVEDQLSRRGAERARLMLSVPFDRASSRLASLPWEYLCTPDQPGRAGSFLALDPALALTRTVVNGSGHVAETPSEEVRILPIVGEADNDQLGRFDAAPVLEAIRALDDQPGFRMLDPVVEATEDAIRHALLGPPSERPHLVHLLGHGRFRDGQGAVALRKPGGGTHWLDESSLARALCPGAWRPAVVFLHTCEGGAVDFEERYGGLAPQLCEEGVRCVIAMRYVVRQSAAQHFSIAMYEALGAGGSLDDGIQRGRQAMWRRSEGQDPRLFGIPSVYQSTPDQLFAPTPATEA